MSESSWFFEQLRRSLVAPHAFARSLAREHFGLAGIVVALAAGVSLSLGLDLLVIAARDLDPGPFTPRLLTDALFMAGRMAVLVALLGLAVTGVLRLVRRADPPTLDQLVTAASFALAPLLLAFPAALLTAIAPILGRAVAVFAILLGARVLYGLAANLRALMPLPAAALAFAVLAAAAGYGLSDELERARFITYRYLPQLAPPLAAEPATGTLWTRNAMALVVPDRWRAVTSTAAGELGRFETDRDALTIRSARGSGILTASDLADQIALSEVRGMNDRASRRDVVRIGERIVVDDRHVGVYEGRRVAVRQFTTTSGVTAIALVFRSIEPTDAEASLAEDASIAATWRLGVAP
jgi:hypothetical protein